MEEFSERGGRERARKVKLEKGVRDCGRKWMRKGRQAYDEVTLFQSERSLT